MDSIHDYRERGCLKALLGCGARGTGAWFRAVRHKLSVAYGVICNVNDQTPTGSILTQEKEDCILG